MNREIRITADGSATLFVPELNEHYHSIYGAVQESKHVFIEAGLGAVSTKIPRVLEFGFGTGLNALLTAMQSSHFTAVHYHALELYPLEWEQVNEMGYAEFLSLNEDYSLMFEAMHTAAWKQWIRLKPVFFLKKEQISFTEFTPSDQYDLVYFDAFAPDVQPESWNESIFRILFDALNEKGILVTYCAKGEIRRRMRRSGFTVERLPGPPGKMEMLRARKQ